MNNTVENDFSGFPKIKWLHVTGEVDKSVRFSCQIFSRVNMPKIIKIGQFLTNYSNYKKVDSVCTLTTWHFPISGCHIPLLQRSCCWPPAVQQSTDILPAQLTATNPPAPVVDLHHAES